ncbi:MAG: hypothetical protein U0Q16_19230 [Bryobacteraceae bacterium]
MPLVTPINLPDKIRLQLIDGATLKPVSGAPVLLQVEFSANEATSTVPVGLLGSNHVGYVSFNLKGRKAGWNSPITSIRAIVGGATPLQVELSDKITSHLAKLDTSAQVIPVTLPPGFVSQRPARLGLLSIEDADTKDWQLSPGSFGVDAVPVLGEDGCEMLLPSHAVERIVRLHQLFRTPGVVQNIQWDPEDESIASWRNWPRSLPYRTGELRHYELAWLPLNHGLGTILYSLTLAPCETVRVAVVDWARSEEASRVDQAQTSDDLIHALRRDRNIEEVVNAVLREHQSGDSFLGGTGGVGGYGGGFGGGGMPSMGGMPSGGGSGSPAPGSGSSGSSGGGAQSGQSQSGQNWGVTGSHSVGYAMANSSGNRDVDVKTTQKIVDEISQASHLVRDLRSTVVVQAKEAEHETVQTRIVRNHNHSHALTILYYEVVRHYLVRALRRQTQPVLFIRYPELEFDEQTAYKHRQVLSRGLLVPSMVENIGALVEKMASPGRDLQALGSAEITSFLVTVLVADDNIGNRERMWLEVIGADQANIVRMGFPGGKAQPHTTTTCSLAVPDGVHLRFSDIEQLGLFYSVEGDGDFRERCAIDGFVVRAVVNLDSGARLLDLLDVRQYYKFEDTSTFWQQPNKNADVLGLARQHRVRQRKIDELLGHLTDNRHHYSSLVWLNESPDERAERFESYLLNGISLSDQIENRPIGVSGMYLAFPWVNRADQPGEPDPGTASILAERIVSMPTRGAFAEAKLSHCNASEVIDDTRFWDWQISPCPDDATQISPVSLSSLRGGIGSGLSPASMGASGVGVQQPAGLPDPGGMRDVMDLLKTSNIFRDMSGIDKLAPLLEKLVEVAGEVEKARIGAVQTLATANRPSASTAGDSDGGSISPTSRLSPVDVIAASPQTMARQSAIVESAINGVEDPAAQADLRQQHAEQTVASMGSGTAGAGTADSGTAPGSRRAPASQRHLSFVFKDSRGAPIRGTYEISVTNTQQDPSTHTRSASTPSPSGNRVSVAIPGSWRTVAVTISVRQVNLVTHDDLDQIRDWFSRGLGTPFAGTTSSPFPLETALEQFVIDPSEPGSTLFDCIFSTRTRTVTVTGSANVGVELSGQLEPSVAEIVRLGEVGGSASGSAGTEVSTQLELVSLTGTLEVRQRN